MERRLACVRMGLGIWVWMAMVGWLLGALESLVVRPILVCTLASVFLLPGLQLGL